MTTEALCGILLPFLGTSLGAACVFLLRKTIRDTLQRALSGFAAGVMVAASIWSLLIPSIEQASALGKCSFIPAVTGFCIGVLFLLALDYIIPRLHYGKNQRSMLTLAVTLHNIPEGMAVGVIYAGYLAGDANITALGALTLSLGIALQNFPEGAIISMPLKADGKTKATAFLGGVASGVVEPIGALITIAAARLVVPALPYFLSFGAGAMIYVVIAELIPRMCKDDHTTFGTIFFTLGFCIMMALDVALG